MPYKIVCLDVHAPQVIEEIRSVLPCGYTIEFAESYDEGEQLSLCQKADFIMVGWPKVDADMINAAKHCKLIQKWGIGYDRIDIEAAKLSGIPVAITAGCNAIPVAELTIALILSVYRKVPYTDHNFRRKGKWLKSEMREQCRMINGKTVGLIGFGAIARRVAKLLSGFEVAVLYYDVNRPTDTEEQEIGVQYSELEDLLRRSDIVSIHIPLNNDTKHLISTSQLAAMKESAILINVSRGGVVDENALISALQQGVISGAGIDVYEQEPPERSNLLFGMDNVVLTCHNGGGVIDNVANVTLHAFKNMQRIVSGEALLPQDIVVPQEY